MNEFEPDAQTKARIYRARADECRAIADGLASASARDALLTVAETYEELADKYENPRAAKAFARAPAMAAAQ